MSVRRCWLFLKNCHNSKSKMKSETIEIKIVCVWQQSVTRSHKVTNESTRKEWNQQEPVSQPASHPDNDSATVGCWLLVLCLWHRVPFVIPVSWFFICICPIFCRMEYFILIVLHLPHSELRLNIIGMAGISFQLYISEIIFIGKYFSCFTEDRRTDGSTDMEMQM